MMRKRTYIASMFIIIAFVLAGFGIQDTSGYKEVKIGTQVWMAENLNVDKFRNGDPIPEARTAEEWKIAGERGQPAWCYYDNDPANGEKYGKLYNWYAVNDPRGLAPAGWHVPSDAEWGTMTNYLGGAKDARKTQHYTGDEHIVARRSAAGAKMKKNTGWGDDDGGTNISGFTALPGGERVPRDFCRLGFQGCWWSSTEYFENTSERAIYYFVQQYGGEVYYDISFNKNTGMSVRCIKN